MISKTITVKFNPSGHIAQVEPGTSLGFILQTSELTVEMPCGGKGRCGKCLVLFHQGAPPPTPAELEQLTAAELSKGYRLACQAVLYEDAVIYLPDNHRLTRVLTDGIVRQITPRPAIVKKHAVVPPPTIDDQRSDLRRVLDAFSISDSALASLPALQKLPRMLREANYEITCIFADEVPVLFEPGDTAEACYGVAVDIGTTTIAAYLLDLQTGEQLSVAASANPQIRYGDDVISRISYATEKNEGLRNLQVAVVEEIQHLLNELTANAEIPLDKIYEISVVGNTCMTHLLLGIDPRYLAQAPYVPVISEKLYLSASEIGLKVNEAARIYILPCIAGYVGADTVGVLLSTALYEAERPILAVDVGTNGEIVLGCRDRILACSTAAGPAFEGAHIKHGMRAAAGAIDAVWIEDADVRFTTIGGVKPVGICGSGLLDMVACLVRAGIIDASGRIVDPEEVPPEFADLSRRLHKSENGSNEFAIALPDNTSTGQAIVLTQRDVREVQLAKGAIAAGILTLMDRYGIELQDLDRVVLAGAFGNYMKKESAIAVGLIPKIPAEKIYSVGNAAGEGAKLALLSTDMRRCADHIADFVEYVELTTDLGFQEKFAQALLFDV